MKTVSFENIRVTGELAFRILKNYARLEESEYRPETIFDIEKNGWPGDWEGRTILSLALLSRITRREPAYLDEIMEEFRKKKNEKGYMKQILPFGQADEQQLSGHNWFTRGLLELYLKDNDRKWLDFAQTIVENLYLPLTDLYAVYPVDPEDRSESGEASGNISSELNGWRLSTDIGCAFMCFDALSQYYEIIKDTRVNELLVKMFDRFRKIDFVRCSMQTHASLSACRGLIRWYQCTGNETVLSFVRRFYRLYKSKGMTATYANYNWFSRPAWTEPCAIVDSLLLALELWKTTKDPAYLTDSHRIFYNALWRSQRMNGGFGCDSCCREEDPGVKLIIPEAYWCCSMRGSEGLSRLALHGCVFDQKNRIYITGLCSGEYRSDSTSLSVTCGYPLKGAYDIEISCKTPKELVFYIPNGVTKGSIILTVNGKDMPYHCSNYLLSVLVSGSSMIHLSFEIGIRSDCIGSFVRYRCGDLFLARVSDLTGNVLHIKDGIPLAAPVSSIYVPIDQLGTRSVEMLFRKNKKPELRQINSDKFVKNS